MKSATSGQQNPSHTTGAHPVFPRVKQLGIMLLRMNGEWYSNDRPPPLHFVIFPQQLTIVVGGGGGGKESKA